MKKALITGITGQDGSYLAAFLLGKGYEVHGIKRRSSANNMQRIAHLCTPTLHTPTNKNKPTTFPVQIHHGDLTDASNIIRIIQAVQPDEIYHLAAQSHVQVSFEMPEYTADVNGIGTLRILEAVRILGLANKTKIYQASTSELFGMAQQIPQTEQTPFYPRSPYAAAKLYAYWITVNYREAYQLFACNGILFNHESPLRGETFVSRKITRAVAHIAHGLQSTLLLGNLDAQRDWGHAKDYVRAMWLMLQQDTAKDFVIATGTTTKVRDFVKMAFQELGITLKFEGTGKTEIGYIEHCHNPDVKVNANQVVVKIDEQYFRPTETDHLIGDASKAQEILNWQPQYSLADMISEMVAYDMQLVKQKLNKDYLSSHEIK